MRDTFRKGDALLIKKIGNRYETGDFVYFKYPKSDSVTSNLYCLQRIIGLPGDTVEIRDKGVYLNNFLIRDTSTFRYNYFVKTIRQPDSLFLARYQLYEGGEISSNYYYGYTMQKTTADSLKMDSLVEKIELKNEQKGSFDETIFPYSTRYNWNSDNFGKLYLPKKNDTLILDSVTINLYTNLISFYEKNKLEIRNDSIFINDLLTNKYCVRQNYFFVLGDNRDNARDSRSWGFLPASCIIGKVVKVLKRNDK